MFIKILFWCVFKKEKKNFNELLNYVYCEIIYIFIYIYINFL